MPAEIKNSRKRLINIKSNNNSFFFRLKVLLRKDKENGVIELAPVYFNSTTKAVINFECDFNKYSLEVL